MRRTHINPSCDEAPTGACVYSCLVATKGDLESCQKLSPTIFSLGPIWWQAVYGPLRHPYSCMGMISGISAEPRVMSPHVKV